MCNNNVIIIHKNCPRVNLEKNDHDVRKVQIILFCSK